MEKMSIEDQIEEMQAKIDQMKQALTLQKGVGVEKDQDGNVGTADAVTGEVDYEKQNFKKKMLINKMKDM